MADGGDGEGAGESCWLAPAAAASVHGGGGDGVLLYDVTREIYDRLRAVGNQEALADPFFHRRFVLLKESGVEDGAVVGVGALGKDPAVEQHIKARLTERFAAKEQYKQSKELDRLIRRPACSLGASDQARQHRRHRRGSGVDAHHQHWLQDGRVAHAPQRQHPSAARWSRCSDVSLEELEVTFAPSSMGGIFCERIRISKIPRWQFQSYANQIHVRMNVSHSLPEKFHWKIQIYFHGNVSTGLCQCEMGEWQALHGGTWNAVKSPYNSRYVDVKLAHKKSVVFSLSIQEELHKWRLACLGIRFVLLFLSPIVSKWAPFYYGSSMALGILLVVLTVIFQGAEAR
ncbi:hypothetical protein ZWY2020_039068 [Hordeum vulgare]|nr:hypothetical protein ZWY2020_039068 [Hordeum vulgare]